jgi:hypothetical protein
VPFDYAKNAPLRALLQEIAQLSIYLVKIVMEG